MRFPSSYEFGRTMPPGETPDSLGGEQVSIGASRAAGDTPLMMTAGEPNRNMPWPIVRHYTFDREYAAVEIGDDEEERGLAAGYCSLFCRFPPRKDKVARRCV